jgi:hypothetical protein
MLSLKTHRALVKKNKTVKDWEVIFEELREALQLHFNIMRLVTFREFLLLSPETFIGFISKSSTGVLDMRGIWFGNNPDIVGCLSYDGFWTTCRFEEPACEVMVRQVDVMQLLTDLQMSATELLESLLKKFIERKVELLVVHDRMGDLLRDVLDAKTMLRQVEADNKK